MLDLDFFRAAVDEFREATVTIRTSDPELQFTVTFATEGATLSPAASPPAVGDLQMPERRSPVSSTDVSNPPRSPP